MAADGCDRQADRPGEDGGSLGERRGQAFRLPV